MTLNLSAQLLKKEMRDMYKHLLQPSPVMRASIEAIDSLLDALTDAGIYFDVEIFSPYMDDGEAVIRPVTGSRNEYVRILKENGFKLVASKVCHETYTRGSALLRVYW